MARIQIVYETFFGNLSRSGAPLRLQYRKLKIKDLRLTLMSRFRLHVPFTHSVLMGIVMTTCPTQLGAKDAIYAVNVAREQATGEKIKGPATIRLRGVNNLRNATGIGGTATFTAQDLRLPFLPVLPAAAKPAPIPAPMAAMVTAAAAVRSGQPATLDSVMVALLERLGGAREALAQLQGDMAAVTGASNGVKAEVESLVMASDAVLQSGGGTDASINAGIIVPIGEITPRIVGVLATLWPDATPILVALTGIRTDLQALPVRFPENWTAWYGIAGNKAVYDSALAQTGELSTAISALGATSASAVAFDLAKKKLLEWKSILSSVSAAGPGGFRLDHKVGCGFTFGSTKEVLVELISADRLAAAGTVAVRRQIVTVVCSTPLSVSGGVGFSTVDENTYGLQPAPKTTTTTTNGVTQTTTTTVNKFGYTARSGLRPLPLVLVNVRLWEPNELFSLHFSSGAAVDLGTGSVGTDVEYVTGVSVGLHRSVFITGGWHIGRSAKLVNFAVGDEAPSGVTVPPLEKQWKPGFLFAITYRIR